MADIIDRELDWDEGFELNPRTFTLLPEGEYEFTVTGFERQRHNGSAKLPPCPKAALTLEIEGAEGSTTITHNLFLHTKTTGLLSAFFISIGLGKAGETVTPNWSKVLGATGRAKIGIRSYEKKDGTPGETNEVREFLPPLQGWTPGGF